jgi:hypothetical protein
VIKEKELTKVKNRANKNVLFHLYKTEQIHAKIFEQFARRSFLTNRQRTSEQQRRAVSVFGQQKLDNEENVL